MDDAIRALYGECGCGDFTADTNDEGALECADCREERETEEEDVVEDE